jgi:hypothetical protein
MLKLNDNPVSHSARADAGVMAAFIRRAAARDAGENFPQKTSRSFDSPPISIGYPRL